MSALSMPRCGCSCWLSGTFTATAAWCACFSFVSNLPVSGQRGRVSTEGLGLGEGRGALGVGLGAEVCTGAGSPDGFGFEVAATPTPTPTIPNKTARRLTCAIDVLRPPQPHAARQVHGKSQNR